MRDVSGCDLLLRTPTRSITPRTPPATAPNTVPSFEDVRDAGADEEDALTPAVNLSTNEEGAYALKEGEKNKDCDFVEEETYKTDSMIRPLDLMIS